LGEGVDSSMIYLIYCKNFCKCHNVLQHNNKNLKKILKKVVIGLQRREWETGDPD
jgi:hypothetical protein